MLKSLLRGSKESRWHLRFFEEAESVDAVGEERVGGGEQGGGNERSLRHQQRAPSPDTG